MFGFDFRQTQHLDRRSLADFAVDFHMAAGLFDEAVDLAQSKARALARFLGCEKWLEGVIEDIFAHSGAGVCYAEHNVLARHDLRV